jgi:hypothetical protein
MKKEKIIDYKKRDIVIEVELNGKIPQPPAYQDTAPRHIILGTIPEMGWVERREVSDLHLHAEIDKVIEEAKSFIDQKTNKPTKEVVEKEKDHLVKLIEKGFE